MASPPNRDARAHRAAAAAAPPTRIALEPPADARLFVALWPDHRVRQALVRHRERWNWPAGARLVAPRDLHVTLHFLGAVPRVRLPELAAALAWQGPAFDLEPTAARCWHGGLAVVETSAPPALLELHDAVGRTLRRLGLRTEARRYRPHVTLARRAAGARPPAQPVRWSWPVRRFVVVESGGPQGAGYHVLHRFDAPAA